MGGKRYAEESLDLDWDSDNYCLAYDVFQHYKRNVVKTDSIPYIDKKDFKSLYPIYSVDLSDQPQKISDTKSNTILHVDFNKHIPDPSGNDLSTVCYIIVVPKYLFLYVPAKNRIVEKNN